MRSVGVRADLHQAGVRHFPHLLPSEEAIARRHQAAEIDRLVGRRIQPDADRRQHRRPVVGLQQREDPAVEAAVAVVEGQQHRLVRQRRAAVLRLQDLLDRHRLVAVLLQPGELFIERAGAHRHVALVRRAVFHVVIRQHRVTVGRPRAFHRSHGPLRRRREARHVRLAAGGGQQRGQHEKRGSNKHDYSFKNDNSDQTSRRCSARACRRKDASQTAASRQRPIPRSS